MHRQNRIKQVDLANLAKSQGRTNDGQGLYFETRRANDASWTLRYVLNGRQRYLGLGPWPLVGLAEARHKATEARKLLLAGLDPVAEKHRARAELAKVMTFQEIAMEYLATDKIQKLKSAKHKAQWHSTLQVAFKAIGKLPIQSIDTKLILDFLMPIWRKTPETCTRIRGRCEAIFNYAISLNRFSGSNPAKRELFAAHFTGRERGHHKAISYEAMPAFVARLRERDGVSAKALELLILSAARTGEVIGARWEEFNLTEATWTVPASRMKAGVEHVVPLPPRAVEILQALPRKGDHVFINGNNLHLSNMAMLGLMKGMGVDATPHGMRACFNTWAKNQTNFAPETRNAALAHTEEKLEQAYTRDKNRLMFDKRRRLMTAWAAYLAAPTSMSATVTRIGKAV